MKRRNPLQELASILGGDTHQLRLLSIVLHLLAASAFISQQIEPKLGPAVDLHLMLLVAPAWFWSVCFLIIAGARTVHLFLWEGVILTRLLFPFVGVLLWCSMWASNIVGNPENANFAVLYLVAAMLEGWIFGKKFIELRRMLRGR